MRIWFPTVALKASLEKPRCTTRDVVFAPFGSVESHCQLAMLIGWSVSVSIEIPLNSLFWKTSWIEKLLRQVQGAHNTTLDHCMHGGARDKASRFSRSTPNENMFASLALRCDGSHTHKSWKSTVRNGVIFYPTKEEAVYPAVLCERMASIFLYWAKFGTLKDLKKWNNSCQPIQILGSVRFSQVNLDKNSFASSFWVWALHNGCHPWLRQLFIWVCVLFCFFVWFVGFFCWLFLLALWQLIGTLYRPYLSSLLKFTVVKMDDLFASFNWIS